MEVIKIEGVRRGRYLNCLQLHVVFDEGTYSDILREMQGKIFKIAHGRFIVFVFAILFAQAISLVRYNYTHASWQYYRSITVTSTATVASGTQSNFPMLFNTTANWLKTTSTDATNGRIQSVLGYDIAFSTSTDCTNPLNYERERYTSSTGELVAWVNEPTLSAGTVNYICYGDASITTDQTNASATWNSSYKGVWHLGNPTSTLSARDSTANANNGTLNNAPTAVTGQIDGGAHFVSSTSQDINVGNGASLGITGNLTESAWVKLTTAPASGEEYQIMSKDKNTGGRAYTFEIVNGAGICGYVCVFFYINGGTPSNRVVSLTALASSTWYYLTGVYNTAGTLKVYVNGCLITPTQVVWLLQYQHQRRMYASAQENTPDILTT